MGRLFSVGPVFLDQLIMKIFNDWRLLMFASLTLGLAPFVPEPHLWGKIKWIAGGAVGMQAIDWLDTLFHGLPVFLLLRLIVILLMENKTIHTVIEKLREQQMGKGD